MKFYSNFRQPHITQYGSKLNYVVDHQAAFSLDLKKYCNSLVSSLCTKSKEKFLMPLNPGLGNEDSRDLFSSCSAN